MTILKQKQRLLAITIFTLIVFAATIQSALAVAPYPNYGTGITVDGLITDWDLTADFFADMIRAGGNPNQPKPVEAKAYLRYDVSTDPNTLYVLVLNQTHPSLKEPENAFVKIDGDKWNNDLAYSFAWVGEGYDGNANHVQGFEAAFKIDPGTYSIQLHINKWDAIEEESQTSGITTQLILIDDPVIVPEASIIITTIAISAAAAVYFVKSKRLAVPKF